MPVTAHHARRAFLLALSDFWVLYFRDRAFLDAYAEGVALDMAQAYQLLLETTLGMSLRDAPAFARTFYRPYVVLEEALRYREGASEAEDTFEVALGEPLVSGEYLVNRVVEPTRVLTHQRDFHITRGRIHFCRDPFVGDAGRGFAETSTRVATPGTWTDPLGREWTGVRSGDTFRIIMGGTSQERVVTGVGGATLYLDGALDALQPTLARRNARVRVLREPFSQRVADALPDHPTYAARVSTETSDAVSVTDTGDARVSALAIYQGAWTALTDYAEGDLVSQSGRVWQSLRAHTSGATFSAADWDDFATGFFYVACDAEPRLNGLYGATTPSAATDVGLQQIAFASTYTLTLWRVRYATTTGAQVLLDLPHHALLAGSAHISARRAAAHVALLPDGTTQTYAANEEVLEGVDYVVDADAGRIYVRTPWAPNFGARIEYSWCLVVADRVHAWRGEYASGTAYALGDTLRSGVTTYVVTAAHTSSGAFGGSNYTQLREPYAVGIERVVRRLAIWVTDALVDESTLYANFGELLGRTGESGEPYRALLRAVAQVFVGGPEFGLLESALNAIAGLPLVRTDGEVLTSYDDGQDASGTATLLGTMSGTDGALDVGTGEFRAASAAFRADDVGAEIRAGGAAYVIRSVVTATRVVVAPAPTVDVTELSWRATHAVMKDRVQLAFGAVRRFTDADVGSWLRLSGHYAPNQGRFRIVSVDDPWTAHIETTYGLLDEAGVAWVISARGTQRVTTTQGTYEYDLDVPLKPAILDATSIGVLSFNAFDALTVAFEVDDYLSDPSWWYRVTIPPELTPRTPIGRAVTPELVAHTYGAADAACFGDPGLYYNADDAGRAGITRQGVVTWYGGSTAVFAPNDSAPGATGTDVGSHLVVSTGPFAGYFPIERVEPDGTTLHLSCFPPPEARCATPPLTFDAELPPLLYRRAVAFLLVDKALKFHAARVRAAPGVAFPAAVFTEVVRLLDETRPSHVYVFVEAGTVFRDELVTEENFSLGLSLRLSEPLHLVDSAARYSTSSPLRFGDAYRFVDRTYSTSAAPGAPIVLPTVLPAGVSVVRTLVKASFATGALVGTRAPAEGVDYDVDYAACTLEVRTGVTIAPDPVTIHYVECVRRIVVDPGDLDAGEVSVVFGGADPTVVRAPGQSPLSAGLVDRAVQITFGS